MVLSAHSNQIGTIMSIERLLQRLDLPDDHLPCATRDDQTEFTNYGNLFIPGGKVSNVIRRCTTEEDYDDITSWIFEVAPEADLRFIHITSETLETIVSAIENSSIEIDATMTQTLIVDFMADITLMKRLFIQRKFGEDTLKLFVGRTESNNPIYRKRWIGQFTPYAKRWRNIYASKPWYDDFNRWYKKTLLLDHRSIL